MKNTRAAVKQFNAKLVAFNEHAVKIGLARETDYSQDDAAVRIANARRALTELETACRNLRPCCGNG